MNLKRIIKTFMSNESIQEDQNEVTAPEEVTEEETETNPCEECNGTGLADSATLCPVCNGNGVVAVD